VMDADGGEWWVDDGQLRNKPYRYHEIRDLPLDELVSEMQTWGKTTIDTSNFAVPAASITDANVYVGHGRKYL